jgi:hypothetical protein
MKKQIFFFLLLVFTLPLQAQTDDNLSGSIDTLLQNCGNQGISFANGELILGSPDDGLAQRIYIIHNGSDYTQLLLSHPSYSNMPATWTSRLDEGQWSAVIPNGTTFNLTCFGRKPGAIGYVNCQAVLQVCSYSGSNISSAGNTWVAENQSLINVMSSIKNQGVKLP